MTSDLREPSAVRVDVGRQPASSSGRPPSGGGEPTSSGGRPASGSWSPSTSAMLAVSSVALMWFVAAAGASAAVPPLAHRGLGVPWSLGLRPSPSLVTAALATSIALGALALYGYLAALRAGWRPPLRRLVLAGTVAALAFVVVPPLGSADYTNYAAYGHIENSGLDAYRVVPSAAARRGVPTAAEVQPPWRSTPSVYGPVAVYVLQVAAWLGGPTLRGTAFWLSLLEAGSFIAAGAILLAMADGEARRARVVVMWFANPLLILEVVGGAHIDGVQVLIIVAALALLRRSRLAAGALVGVGMAVKLTAGIVGLGMAHADRRSPRRLAALAVGAVVVVGAAYLTASSAALDQTRRASRFISPMTLWWWTSKAVGALASSATSHLVTTAGGALLAVAVAVAVLRLVPQRAGDPGAVRSAFAYSVGWLFGAPYVLPWYDSLAWATAPLVEGSVVDRLLVAHTAVIALGMLPGRKVGLPSPLAGLMPVVRAGAVPVAVVAILVVLFRRAGAARRADGGTTNPGSRMGRCGPSD